MKRVKMVFAIFFLMLALPFWRFTDLVAIISPLPIFLTFALSGWFALFITIPAKLILVKLKTWWLIGSIILWGVLIQFTGPLSKMATKEPDHNHCGSLTYTGFFYPLRNIVTEAHRDDLEARNQLCWVRKMISRVPKKFDQDQEVQTYVKLIEERLFLPELKFRVSLPLIALLYGRIYSSQVDVVDVKKIYESVHFWIEHYTEEISLREYSFWNWPHSDYIKWEYGLIERNWQQLVDNLVIETN